MVGLLVRIEVVEEQGFLLVVMEAIVKAEVQQTSSVQLLVELRLEELTSMVVSFAVVAGKQLVKV